MKQSSNFRRNIFVRLMLAATAISMLVATDPGEARAWDQGKAFKAHQEINQQALLRFFAQYGNTLKYANSQVDRTRNYGGPEVIGNTYIEKTHTVQFGMKSFQEWVIHGGFSADEPELWAAVKHFYNPITNVGPPQLTDQDTLHGLYMPATSARYWAFASPDNPYSWKKALEYYKKSMEIADDDGARVIPGSDFRDPALTVDSPAQLRNDYLGKAFRSLGETMHMIADMTQPAHTRNDSHPVFNIDPVEAGVTETTVLAVCDYPVEPGIGAQIDQARVIAEMYDYIALFTNEYFYSSDTIYDKDAKVPPHNGENPYPLPQFKELIPLASINPPKVATGDPLIYGRYFNKKLAPLIQKSYIYYAFGPMVSPAKRWIVPMAFAFDQAGVLIPIAIKANIKVIDRFFPTMDFSMELQRSSSPSQGRQEFNVVSRMTHMIDKDLDWQQQGMQPIQYSGPAELWNETKNKRLSDSIQFRNGSLKKGLILYTGEPKSAPSADADRFQIEDGDSVYMVINAGGRTFKTVKCGISSCRLEIQPGTLAAVTGRKYIFTAVPGAAPANPVYSWKVDGRKIQSGPGNSLSVAFTAAGSSIVSVILRDGGRECTSSALVAVRSTVQPSPSQDVVPSTNVPASPTSDPPMIRVFESELYPICDGQSSILWWTVENATSVTIEPGVGPVPSQGSKYVSPAVTTTYTLTATNAAGSRQGTARVNLCSPSDKDCSIYSYVGVMFHAFPDKIRAGESTVLNWCVTGNSVEIGTNEPNPNNFNLREWKKISSVGAKGTMTVVPTDPITDYYIKVDGVIKTNARIFVSPK